jgi:RNA polymerase sigma-70 factor (ECF subfamily)
MNETPANPLNAITDEMLMRSFSQGSQEAFTELFRRYRQPIYGFFCRRVPDPSRAEELEQETFLVLLRSGVRYEPRALFRTYLYAIALKILRADRRKTTFRAAFFGPQGTILDPAKQDATESDLWVRRAIAKLAPMDREIVLLREFEQLSYGEIAELLQLAVNTVRSRLFRARVALRALLEAGTSTATNDAPQAAPQCAPQSIVQKGERA